MLRFIIAFGLTFSATLPAILSQPAHQIDFGEYASATAAASNWIAGEGSAPASVQNVDGKSVLALPCKFAGTQLGRGVWDRKVSLDLSEAQGIEFEVLCTKAAPSQHFHFTCKAVTAGITAPSRPATPKDGTGSRSRKVT